MALERLSSNKFLEGLTEKLREAGEIWTKKEVIQQSWLPNCLCFVFAYMRDDSRGDSGVRTSLR